MKRHDEKQFSLDLKVPMETEHVAANEVELTIRKNYPQEKNNGGVIVATEKFEKKRQEDMARVYTSIVERAKHLFD
jgi:hypothetical protein